MAHLIRNFHCNSSLFQRLSVVTCFLLIGIFLITSDSHSGSKKRADEKIHISAEALVVDGDAKYAEFTGNVKVIQGNTTITSDRLRIFYNKIPNQKKSANVEKSIKKIIAKGHVRITFEDKIAETQEAVYTTKDKIFVLSGENSKITTGGNSISGSKITLYQTDGRIKIESSKKKRVEAIFFSGETESSEGEGE